MRRGKRRCQRMARQDSIDASSILQQSQALLNNSRGGKMSIKGFLIRLPNGVVLPLRTGVFFFDASRKEDVDVARDALKQAVLKTQKVYPDCVIEMFSTEADTTNLTPTVVAGATHGYKGKW